MPKLSRTGPACILAAAVAFGATAVIDANAAEIKILSAIVMKPVLDDLARSFERTSGHKANIAYAPAGGIRDRIQVGEAFDVTILPLPMVELLVTQQKIANGSAKVLARSTVAVCTRAGTPRPPIDTADTLKKTLLDAPSIAFSDPAIGSALGVHFARVLDRLGIAEQMKPKTKLTGPDAPEFVARGEAALCVSQTMEILAASGVELVGPLPAELQNKTAFSFTLGISAAPAEAAAAQAFSAYLRQPDAARTLKAKGMEPGGE